MTCKSARKRISNLRRKIRKAFPDPALVHSTQKELVATVFEAKGLLRRSFVRA